MQEMQKHMEKAETRADPVGRKHHKWWSGLKVHPFRIELGF